MFLLSRFSKENRRKRKMYRRSLSIFKEGFEQTMLKWNMAEAHPNQGDLSWNTMDLWATAIMMDEAKTLSRLTRWLIVLSVVLSALTSVLAYPIIKGLLAK